MAESGNFTPSYFRLGQESFELGYFNVMQTLARLLLPGRRVTWFSLISTREKSMRYKLLAGVAAGAVGLAFAGSAYAGGNIILTGHDDDYHCTYGDYHTSPGSGLARSSRP